MAKAADDKVIMTRDGYEKLKAELVSLRGDGRAEIAAKLEEARAFGDLSENAEYHAAKEEQEKLENLSLIHIYCSLPDLSGILFQQFRFPQSF